MLTGSVMAGALGFLSRSGGDARNEAALAERVRALQEEVGKKDLALTLAEKRILEFQESPAPVSAPVSRFTEPSPSAGPAATSRQLAADHQSPLRPLKELETAEIQGGTRAAAEEESPAAAKTSARDQQARRSAPAEPLEESLSKVPVGPSATGPIVFDAEAVTATMKNPNSGTLSFRLVKDRPDVRFAGYLFVFVEMVDQRGETKIFAYPKPTIIGEGDLPANYKDGETLDFKYNSRVELPFEDARSGATFQRVSILLYGPDGSIVYQRGIDRREVKVVTAKAGGPDAPRGGTERRRAL